MSDTQPSLSTRIRAYDSTRKLVETALATDQRVLARITDGIYRQPASALRELISNAYDADATEVIILTDAPRFGMISVRDDGTGLSPEVLEHLIQHIGGSAKRTTEGKDLGVTDQADENRSPGGRQLIGKMGIGLFSVAQFTRHFLIITKTKGDSHRTIADITLGPVAGGQPLLDLDSDGQRKIETGHARIWRERADDRDSHGTEIKLLDLLPRTRAELASEDVWAKIEFERDDPDAVKTVPPKLHIGRMKPKQSDLLEVQPRLPWEEGDTPSEKFERFVQAVRDSLETDSEHVDLDLLCDRYLRTIWDLAISAPLKYFDVHPFDLKAPSEFRFFELENKARGQAKRLSLQAGQSPRTLRKLEAPDGAPGAPFCVNFDGVELSRPIFFNGLPKTKNAVQTPLIFVGKDVQKFEGKPSELSGGPLVFEAYLFWAPKIIPKQHQGVVLRVGNASGALFDRTFMNYQVSEQTRLRQITAEVFVHEGLDGAINLDRESFNFAHPHYQYLVKWLHSALRQLTNKHKELGKELRSKRVASDGEKVRAEMDSKVGRSLRSRGVEDVPEVVLLEPERKSEARKMRSEGAIVLHKAIVIPSASGRKTSVQDERQKTAESKARAIAQLLHGWGLLDSLSYEDQEQLIHDILEIVMLDTSKNDI
jgi:hypothetical protein